MSNNTLMTKGGKPAHKQEFQNGVFTVYTLKRSSTGEVFAEIFPRGRTKFYVPRDICSLAAGKDAWMRDITFKCEDCGTRHRAGDSQCGFCPECTAKAEEENARMDSEEV